MEVIVVHDLGDTVAFEVEDRRRRARRLVDDVHRPTQTFLAVQAVGIVHRERGSRGGHDLHTTVLVDVRQRGRATAQPVRHAFEVALPEHRASTTIEHVHLTFGDEDHLGRRVAQDVARRAEPIGGICVPKYAPVGAEGGAPCDHFLDAVAVEIRHARDRTREIVDATTGVSAAFPDQVSTPSVEHRAAHDHLGPTVAFEIGNRGCARLARRALCGFGVVAAPKLVSVAAPRNDPSAIAQHDDVDLAITVEVRSSEMSGELGTRRIRTSLQIEIARDLGGEVDLPEPTVVHEDLGVAVDGGGEGRHHHLAGTPVRLDRQLVHGPGRPRDDMARAAHVPRHHPRLSTISASGASTPPS